MILKYDIDLHNYVISLVGRYVANSTYVCCRPSCGVDKAGCE